MKKFLLIAVAALLASCGTDVSTSDVVVETTDSVVVEVVDSVTTDSTVVAPVVGDSTIVDSLAK
tara:strand:- start:192 stop:383 length:192 start_codon:yes stop_codon:yes gene_type:complete